MSLDVGQIKINLHTIINEKSLDDESKQNAHAAIDKLSDVNIAKLDKLDITKIKEMNEQRQKLDILINDSNKS